jgi:hypothetical protein
MFTVGRPPRDVEGIVPVNVELSRDARFLPRTARRTNTIWLRVGSSC